MLKRTVSLLVVSLLTCPLLAAPLNKAQVAANAKWLVHADVDGFLATKVGQAVLQELKKKGIDEALTNIQTTFGFDPTKDLKSLTVYGAGYGEQYGVVLIRANLDREKLVGMLKNNPAYKETKHGDHVLHQWTDEAKDGKPAQDKFGAFCGDDLAVMAPSLDLLKSALDVLDGKADSLAKDESPGMGADLPKGIFAMARLRELPVAGKGKPEAALINKLAAGSAEIGENDGKVFVRVALTAKTDQAATDLQKIAEGFLAFLDLIQSDDPQAKPILPPQLAALVKDATVQKKDKTVQACLTIPVADLMSLLETLTAQDAAKKAAQAPSK